MPLSEFKNVFFDYSSKYEFSNLAESSALIKTFHTLSLIMQNEFDKYLFYILASDDIYVVPESLFLKCTEKKVLIWISDESGTIPNNFSEHYYAVFKSYLKTEITGFENVLNFPLCCVKDVPFSNAVPMINRNNSVFFIGYLNHNRINFYINLVFLKFGISFPKFTMKLTRVRKLCLFIKSNFDSSFLNAHIRFTKGFRQGVSPKVYGQLIADSKIVLCPNGIVSAECFRHYEAMRSGCVIISEQLPLTYFYKNSPIIQIDNWKVGFQIVNKLLDNPIELQHLGDLTQKWWVENCSEEGTAHFINRKLGCFSS